MIQPYSDLLICLRNVVDSESGEVVAEQGQVFPTPAETEEVLARAKLALGVDHVPPDIFGRITFCDQADFAARVRQEYDRYYVEE